VANVSIHGLLSVILSAYSLVAMFSKTHPELDPFGSNLRKNVIWYERIDRPSRVLIVMVHRYQFQNCVGVGDNDLVFLVEVIAVESY
jgi:hypothetical protein